MGLTPSLVLERAALEIHSTTRRIPAIHAIEVKCKALNMQNQELTHNNERLRVRLSDITSMVEVLRAHQKRRIQKIKDTVEAQYTERLHAETERTQTMQAQLIKLSRECKAEIKAHVEAKRL